MILYFSGTGNSEYIAKRIGKECNKEVINLFEKIKNHDYVRINSDSPWIIVTPTYAWRIPRVLQEWLEQTELSGNRQIYFIMTCGGNIGNAGKYLKKLCDFKNMEYLGCFPVVMPENYIAMFSTPTKEKALKMIKRAERKISKIVDLIQKDKPFPPIPITIKDKLNSSIINDIFYPMFVKAKKFYAKDTCISCGKCANVCPMNNICIKNGKPVWGKNCTHCMACICHCPNEAIEYGKHSEGRMRYTCPK